MKSSRDPQVYQTLPISYIPPDSSSVFSATFWNSPALRVDTLSGIPIGYYFFGNINCFSSQPILINHLWSFNSMNVSVQLYLQRLCIKNKIREIIF